MHPDPGHRPTTPHAPNHYQGGTWWPLHPDRWLKLLLDTTPPASDPEGLDRCWHRMLGDNPRLFDGPLAVFAGFDPQTATLRYRLDSYRRYAVQPEIDTGLFGLAVTGVLTAPGPDARPRILLARRSHRVAVMPNRWEAAPSGTIPADQPGDPLTLTALIDLLCAEAREELGFDLDPALPTPLALIADDRARSVDVAFHIHLDAAFDPDPDPEHAWECVAFAWTHADGLARLLADDPPDRCVPTLAAILDILRRRGVPGF